MTALAIVAGSIAALPQTQLIPALLAAEARRLATTRHAMTSLASVRATLVELLHLSPLPLDLPECSLLPPVEVSHRNKPPSLLRAQAF